MHIDLLFTMTYQPTTPINSSTCSLLVIMFLKNTILLKFISSFTPYAEFKILFYYTIIIIISKNKNNFTDICSVKVFPLWTNPAAREAEFGLTAPRSSYCILFYYSCLRCLTLYSGRGQKHLSGPSDSTTFISVVPCLLCCKGSKSNVSITENRSQLQVASRTW